MRPGKAEDRRDVVLVGRVEPAELRRRFALDQPVGADHALRPGSDRVVDHQQVVGDRVEPVPVAAGAGGFRVGPGTQFAVEHPVAQRLYGVDLGRRGGNAHAQIARAQFGERPGRGRHNADPLFHRHRVTPRSAPSLTPPLACAAGRSCASLRRRGRLRLPPGLRGDLSAGLPGGLSPDLTRGTPAEQLQPQGDQVEAQSRRDGLHQTLMFRVLEFDDFAGFHVDQVVVVAMLGRLVAGASAAEIPALEDPVLLEQTDRAVDGGDRDVRIEGSGAAVQFLDVGMVGRVRQDTGDDPPLSGHLEAPFDAQAFDARFHPIPCDQTRQPILPDQPVPAREALRKCPPRTTRRPCLRVADPGRICPMSRR